MSSNTINDNQKNFYQSMFNEHGYSVKSVGFGNEIYQDARFERLANIFKDEKDITVHEIGFGLGHFYEYLQKKHPDRNIEYSGSEIMEDFYKHCSKIYPDIKLYLRDIGAEKSNEQYDYVVLNGVFNPKCNTSRKEWEKHILNLLSKAFSMANKGVAFSILSEFCDFYDKELYYCNTMKFLNYINDNLSRFIEYNQAYPLYEVTFFVYKEKYIKSLYKDSLFNKYFKE
jgi:hypothetical protein